MAVAEERDGIAAEPPIDVEEWANRFRLDGMFVAIAAEEADRDGTAALANPGIERAAA